ncbi:MAG: exonuclease domain-containing protein [Candidatus Gracilibacteria bacterium]|nr:exonuclease domain-containing protein [Candidatus Gracilibacteria bacterium]
MFVCLDLETTGLDAIDNEIIEIAIVKFDENTGKVVDTFETFVKPFEPIPELIQNLTGISNEDVEKAPFFDEVKTKIEEFIGDLVIVGHNIKFDIKFLVAAGVDIVDNIYIDTFFMANILLREEKSLNLEALAKRYLNIESENFHRALEDTLATKDLFIFLVKYAKKLKINQRKILNYTLSKSSDNNVAYLRKFLDLIEEDKKIDSEKFVDIILKSIKKFQYNEIIQDEDANNFDEKNIFDNKYISQIDNFESRQNQIEMGQAVWDNLFESKKTLIEAPTGVGKTYAYTLPSIKYSTMTGNRVIISTKTKNLQDQLFFKDLDKLSTLDLKFSYAKLKGRSNYLGLFPFLEKVTLDSNNMSWEESALFGKLSMWLLDTVYGELDEINIFPHEYPILKEITADNYISVESDENPYKKEEFIYKARNNAQKSNILIINHSLLLQDMQAPKPIIGEYYNLIIDESHNLEDTATDALKSNMNYNYVSEIFDELVKILEKNKKNKKEILEIKEQLLFNLREIFEILSDYLSTKFPVFGEQRYVTTLLKDDFYSDFLEKYEEVSHIFEIKLVELFDIFNNYDDEEYAAIMGQIEKLEEILNIIKISKNPLSREDYILVCFFTENTGINLYYTLLNPGKSLKEKLWDKLDSCLLTSATLKIGDSFDYIDKMLSTDDFDKIALETDFDYKKQSLLYIPTDLGSIKFNDVSIIKFLKEFLLIVGGQTLLLLTSFAKIKEYYLGLNSELKNNGITLFSQSIGGGKNKLIEFFKENAKNSVLMGTDSFWEGVDISGDDLKYLVIHKFPFPVPTDPIFIARSKLFKDAFRDYSIPKTILKLKQGFGRLIRNKNDKGIVILLDDRIYSSGWGNALYKAFPDEITVRKGQSQEFFQALNKRV